MPEPDDANGLRAGGYFEVDTTGDGVLDETIRDTRGVEVDDEYVSVDFDGDGLPDEVRRVFSSVWRPWTDAKRADEPSPVEGNESPPVAFANPVVSRSSTSSVVVLVLAVLVIAAAAVGALVWIF